MRFCELTLASPEENLSCDEVLLDWAEEQGGEAVIRFWEPTQYFVVLGYANRAAVEVNLEFCNRNQIPVLRRCSGGGTVLQGPGCLNYSLILPITDSPELSGIATTNHYVLQRHREALQALLRAPVERLGHTDLTIGGLKFSGNSQRRKKDFLLFHGSFLLNADIGLIEKALAQPSQQPAYRAKRSHADFLMNLKLPAKVLRTTLLKTWQSTKPLDAIPLERISKMAQEKYKQNQWNFKF